MSPILVRPVREQFEHDRVIRVLQAKYKRKYEVTINPGAEQNAAVGVGDLAMYPDLVLFSQERVRKVQGTVEVETTESINTLEAMAEWGPFSRLRTPFFLYVPANSIDTVRRLCTEHSIDPAEIWTYHTALDQVRFTMVHRSPDAPKGSIAEHKPKPVVPVVVSTDEEPEDNGGSTVAASAAAKTARAAAPVAPSKAGAASPPGKTVAGKGGAGKAAPGKGPAGKAAAAKAAAPARPDTNEKHDKSGKNDKASKVAKGKPAPAKAASAKTAKAAKSAKSAKPVKAAKSVKAKGTKPVKKSKAARR